MKNPRPTHKIPCTLTRTNQVGEATFDKCKKRITSFAIGCWGRSVGEAVDGLLSLITRRPNMGPVQNGRLSDNSIDGARARTGAVSGEPEKISRYDWHSIATFSQGSSAQLAVLGADTAEAQVADLTGLL